MSRTLWVALALVSALLLALAGCGGKKQTTATSPAASSAQATDAAIKARLTKAGYSIEEDSVAGSKAPARDPGEVDGFSVQANFTSPDSYHLGIAVFDSRRAVSDYLRRITAAQKKAEASASCKADPSCKAFFDSLESSHSPMKQRVLGDTVYTGIVDKPGATLPVKAFDALVALAAGQAT
jgi:hypothetical protein